MRPTTSLLRSLGRYHSSSGWFPLLSSSSSVSCRPSTRGLSTEAAELRDAETDAEVFERLVAFRCSMKSFLNKEVPEDILRNILAVTQRAPTSFNLQPYKVIVVKSPKVREQLASCMLGPNKRRISMAPVTAIFAADLEPTRLLSRLVELERKRGTPEAYLANLPFQVRSPTTTFTARPLYDDLNDLEVAFLAGEGQLAHVFKEAVTAAMSPLQAMPTVNNVDAWSYKNTMLAAAWYMLSAASHGLSTCPMEGFDGRRLQTVLGIPPRYSVPIAVCTGYGDERALEELTKTRRTTRFPPDTVFHLDSYGQPYKGIPVL